MDSNGFKLNLAHGDMYVGVSVCVRGSVCAWVCVCAARAASLTDTKCNSVSHTQKFREDRNRDYLWDDLGKTILRLCTRFINTQPCALCASSLCSGAPVQQDQLSRTPKVTSRWSSRVPDVHVGLRPSVLTCSLFSSSAVSHTFSSYQTGRRFSHFAAAAVRRRPLRQIPGDAGVAACSLRTNCMCAVRCTSSQCSETPGITLSIQIYF